MTPVILVLNAGSSSVNFSVFRVAGAELHIRLVTVLDQQS